ncbi:hypothetical protein ACLMJK_005730 [Lecanora helva]
MHTNVLILKAEGNTHIKNGDYPAAIKSYNEALRQTRSEADAVTLLNNRCHARLLSLQYEAALADAEAVIELSPSEKQAQEKAYFRAARALYGLRRWEHATSYISKLITTVNSNNKAANELMARCLQRVNEESGDYDFQSMLDEAVSKFPNADMDRADFVGCIEIRECEIKSLGRGMFTTKDVAAGELLLCEKAMAVAFADPNAFPEASGTMQGEDASAETKEVYADRRAELEANTIAKLEPNPTLAAKFLELYPGPDHKDQVDEKTGETVIDDSSITTRIAYNAFGFPLLTHNLHYLTAHTPQNLPDSLTGSRGIWHRASFINHSCYPLVRRSFIGDMMIFRAQANIPKDTELKFGYISGLEIWEERQKALRRYGFECDCAVCVTEGETSEAVRGERFECVKRIIDVFERGDVTAYERYTELLDRLEGTYTHPPQREYRRAMITPLTNLITGCLQSGLHAQVIELTHRLLHALGFELEITEQTYTIVQWGFLIDEIVVAMVDLVDAYAIMKPELVEDARREARKCYLIMCGEDVSWEEVYGVGGRREREQREEEKGERVEDIVDGVNGLEFV